MNKSTHIGLYVFFGVLTTGINIICYTLLANIFSVNYIAATSIAWIISVLFAFVTNKLYVFKNWNNKTGFLKEMVLFILLRSSSYLVDAGTMIIFVEILAVNDVLSKIMINFIIVVLNYILSKHVVFKASHNN
ncbi:Putative flippase GtrA (transmembrane translocase of bactoprenol-linked glucose) [Paenibacillus sp. 1_12]|uniref:GtrA family protein n=1 Tax=Paenibacillus sp. 1_12 TaxID=1566278 RepID=UPI0008EAF3EB|nr:Putative flippase GtrA (transmembrane translocase of bactoprenol-linked glucose) [Paenibacillus sp. 1_12]